MDARFLKIADLIYKVPSSVNLPQNYKPFAYTLQEGDLVNTEITIDEVKVERKELCHKGLLIDNDKELCVYRVDENNGGYYAVVQNKNEQEIYELLASPTWDKVTLSPNCTDPTCLPSLLDILMMLIFIYSGASHSVILLHASCVKLGDSALAFIGHSGAGKSTHSRLWLEHVPGTSLLNDDQPAVRVFEDGHILIFGTPWSGKTPCYKSDYGTLQGIVRMKQAPLNQITPFAELDLFRELLASCSMMKSDPSSFRLITSTLARVASHVPGFVLQNKPEKAAVDLVYAHTIQQLI